MQYTLAIPMLLIYTQIIYPTNLIDKARGTNTLIEARIMLSNQILVALSAVYSVGVRSDSARSLSNAV